jgi:hypothetical protein
MDTELLEGVVQLCVVGAVFTVVMVIMIMGYGRIRMPHWQATRYVITSIVGLGAAAPAWWIWFSGMSAPAYELVVSLWEYPFYGWLIGIGYWCSLIAPATTVLALFAVKLLPATSQHPVRAEL